LRALHYLQATSVNPTVVAFEPAQEKVTQARAQAFATAGKNAVRMLFVVQSHAFLAAVRAYQLTGKETDELRELAGPFLQRLRQAEWIVGSDVQVSERELRVLYKLMWGFDTGLEAEEGFAVTLDERRVLYGLYLRKPHPPEHLRSALLRAKEHAGSRELCVKVEDETRAASEKWRIGKIAAVGEFDANYPTEYALGIAHFRLGDYQASGQSFRRWIDQHPGGPWTLRAQNFLKAAQKATQDMP
jgi:hypothetical protein